MLIIENEEMLFANICSFVKRNFLFQGVFSYSVSM